MNYKLIGLRLIDKLLDFLIDDSDDDKKQHPHPPHQTSSLGLNFSMPQLKRSKNSMIEISINNEQKIKVTLAPVTAGGKPAVLDGIPVWSIVNGNSTFVPAADGLSCELISSDTLGDTVYMVTADSNLGSGVTNISDTITMHVLNAPAVGLGLVAGTPEQK